MVSCYNKEKATLEEDPEKAQTVRLIFYTFANENLSLRKLADKLNRLHIPTPRGGDRWRASTLGVMLRNEVYIGKMHQFKKYHIEPKFRLKPLAKNKKNSTALRPKEEWISVEVPSLIPVELFEAVQRKLKKNAELSKRNTKRQYLLSGLYTAPNVVVEWVGMPLMVSNTTTAIEKAIPIGFRSVQMAALNLVHALILRARQ